MPPSKQVDAYLGTTAMRATQSTMALASSILGFDIVELWTEEGDGKLHCTYVHASEDTVKRYPEIIAGHYPNHKKEHKLSPEVSPILLVGLLSCMEKFSTSVLIASLTVSNYQLYH